MTRADARFSLQGEDGEDGLDGVNGEQVQTSAAIERRSVETRSGQRSGVRREDPD